MDTWKRLIDLRGGWGGMEEISQRTYMHVCKTHGHRQQCGEGQERRSMVEEGKGWEKEDICNMLTIKNLRVSCSTD